MSALRSMLPVVVVIISLAMSGCIRNAKLQPYTGQWVLRNSGKDMFVLHTRVRRRRIVGSATHPVHFHEQPDGSFSGVSNDRKTVPISNGHLKNGSLLLSIGRMPDQGQISMTLQGKNHALLDYFHGYVPAMKLEKVGGASAATRKH